MASVVNSFGVLGIDGYMVKIETDTIYGQPSVSIVGMGDTAIKESRDRVEAAIINSKFEFPKMKIVINLSPSDTRKRGAYFDLGMAVSLLAQSGQVLVSEIESYGFIGELSLNGDLRPCSGVLPMFVEARRNGIRNVVVPMENAPVSIMDLSDNKRGPSSKELREKVEVARKIQRERYKSIKEVSCNSQMTPELIREYCVLNNEGKKIMHMAYDKFRYSARTYNKFLKVARTIADLNGESEISKAHLIKALMCRELEKEQGKMFVVGE